MADLRNRLERLREELRDQQPGGSLIAQQLAYMMLIQAQRLSSDGLSAIAQSLGYDSESAFEKAFRRVMGCSPRRYARPPTEYAVP